MKISDLRDVIIARLDSLLGVYEIQGLGTVPAIAVDDSNSYPPAGTVIHGLEVVLEPNIGLSQELLLTGRLWENSHRLTLKQWDRSGDTLEATRRVLPLLGNSVVIRPRILANEELGAIESQEIEFNNPELIRD